MKALVRHRQFNKLLTACQYLKTWKETWRYADFAEHQSCLVCGHEGDMSFDPATGGHVSAVIACGCTT